MGEEEKEEEEEAAPRTIDIKFNYPQTSAFPSHYFVQQSQLLPFKRFQSIQRRKGEERRRGGRELESPAVSFTRPLSTPPSIHNVFTTFRPRTQNPRIVSRARVSGRGFYRSPFLKHTRAGERERVGNVQLSSLFPFPIRFHASIVPSTDLFFSPPPPPPPPILSTTNDISHGRSVNGISFFLLSLSLSWKIVGRRERKRENGDHSLYERIFFNKNFVYFFFEIVKKILEIL